MSLKAKLLLDSSDYNKKMDQAKAKASNTGKQIKEKLQQGGKGFEAINKFGGKFGGVLKNLSEGIAGLMSPIGLVMAGVAALGSFAVKVWDKMTESAQQYKARMQSMANILKSENEQIDKNKKQSDELLDILEKLQKQESLSNAQKLLAIKVIEQLTAKYGDLGIQIDSVTGKIKNFDDVQRELEKRQKDKKNQKLAEIEINARQQAHRQASQMTREIGHDWNISGTQVYRYDTNEYKSLKDAQNMGFDVKFNPTHDLTYIPGSRGTPGVWHKTELSDEQKRLRQLWNEGGIQGKMQFAKGMQQRYKGDEETRKIFEELYKKLKEYREADKNLNAFERYGTTDPNEIIRKINEEAKVQKKQDAQTKTKVDSMKQQQELKKEQTQFKSLDTDAQRIQFYQKKLNKEKEIGLELQKKSAEVLEKRKNKVQQYNELVEKLNSGKLSDEQNLEVSQKALTLLRQINNLNAQNNDITIQLTENTGKQLQLELAIKQLKQKSSDYYESSLEALNAEIQITKLKLQGLNEQAEKQQLINELKLKGLMVDEAEVDKILEKRRQLAKLNKQLEEKNKGQQKNKDPYSVSGKSLQDKINQNLNPRGYAYQKRLEEQQKKKGEALSKKEKSQIKQIVELQFKAQTAMNLKPDLSGFQTFTNELASRGGFSQSVVNASKNDVNQRIFKTQKQSEATLKTILTEMKKLGVIS